MTDAIETPRAVAAIATQGATTADLSEGHSSTGHKAPEPPSNTKPDNKGDDEVHGIPVKKAPSETKTPEQKAADDAAAKAAAEAKPPVEDVANPEIGVTEYITLDNPVGQAAIETLKAAGVSPMEANVIFNKAIESGNLEDVDWAALQKKVKPHEFQLIKSGVETYYNDEYKEVSATVAKGYEIVGGEDNWKTVVKWSNAKAKADPAYAKVENDIRKAINQNGFIAEAAVTKLKSLYEADPKNSSLGAQTVKIATGDSTGAPVEPLSKQAYLAAMHELQSRKHTAAEVQALRNRRMAGMSAGI